MENNQTDKENLVNDALVFADEMKKNADKFARSTNFIVSFEDIPQIQIRTVKRVENELYITCFESEIFCVEDYIRNLKHSNKNGKFDITVVYLTRDLKPYRVDTFTRCKIKSIIPNMLNQVYVGDGINKINLVVKFKKHGITTK